VNLAVGRFPVERMDPWTPIYNRLVEERWREEYSAVPTRYVVGLDPATSPEEIQQLINKAIRRTTMRGML
jgi:predicted metal-dependent TIM-barrel fold hydrolase